MKKTWMVKLGTPILALALVSACGTTDDDVPQDNNENPGVENERNEVPNDNMNGPNNENMHTPGEDLNDPNQGNGDNGVNTPGIDDHNQGNDMTDDKDMLDEDINDQGKK